MADKSARIRQLCTKHSQFFARIPPLRALHGWSARARARGACTHAHDVGIRVYRARRAAKGEAHRRRHRRPRRRRQRRSGGSHGCGVATLPGCRVAGVPGGVYNRTICRSLSRTREVRRSANQIGIPPLVHCHKMAALNQPDSAYCAPPLGAPLAARHEKLRLSIHFYRSCFFLSLLPPPSRRGSGARSVSLSRLAPRISVSFRARSSFSLCRFLAPPLVRASTRASLPSNNRSLCSIARHTRLPCPFACLLVRRSRFSDAVSALRLFSFFSRPTADLRSVLDTRASACAQNS